MNFLKTVGRGLMRIGVAAVLSVLATGALLGMIELCVRHGWLAGAPLLAAFLLIMGYIVGDNT